MKKRIAALLGGVLVATALSAPVAMADPQEERPDFKAPYQCEEKGWKYFSEHQDSDGEVVSGVIDINKGSGDEDLGEPVLASAAGTAHLGEDPDSGGHYVEIDHVGGWQTGYFHLDTQDVVDGAKVEQGDRIGTLGKSGVVTAAHLHFQQKLDGELVDNIHLEGQDLPASLPESESRELVSTNCGDGGGDEPAEPEATTLKYTGDKSISNGSDAELSADLTTKESDGPVEGRKVAFALGAGDSPQTCTGETDADGHASCTVEVADQKLTDDATVPLVATFAGDDAYVKSEDRADLRLQHVEGRAYGLSAEVPLPLLPVGIDPTPDTGTVRTAAAQTKGPECAQGVDALVLSVDALCAAVETLTGPSSVTSTATVADATLGLPGLPVIGISGLTSKSTSTCEKSTGSVDLELTVAGTPVEIPDTPGYEVDLGLVGRLVVNEQTPVQDADGGLTVNAVHLTTPAGADVVLGSSTSSAHDCA